MGKRMISLLFGGILMFSLGSVWAQEDDEFGFMEEKAAPKAKSKGSAAAVKIDNPATLKGKVTFDGKGPKKRKIKMNADPTCLAMHSEDVFNKDVVIGANGEFANVFVYVKSGLEGRDFPVPSEPVRFDQVGCEYEPRVFGVRAGQPIEIVNSDSTLHNVHALPAKNSPFNVGMPIKGMKLKKTFKKPEQMVKIVCDVHPWMNGYVGVMSHPYFFTTGKDGSFEIGNLPPGKYVVAAWQERLGEKTMEVTVGGNETKELSFVFTRPKK